MDAPVEGSDKAYSERSHVVNHVAFQAPAMLGLCVSQKCSTAVVSESRIPAAVQTRNRLTSLR